MESAHAGSDRAGSMDSQEPRVEVEQKPVLADNPKESIPRKDEKTVTLDRTTRAPLHTRPHYASSHPPTMRAMAGKEESEPPTLGASSGDKLVLRGMQFHGFHGVKQEEKKLGQKFVVDVDAWMDLAAAGGSDDISDTVSYTDIYRIAKGVVEGPPHNLLESVAQSIANSTLLSFPQISAVRVKVGKPHVAVQGVLDYLGVEILRYKKA